jgi:hypothetical protein
MRTPVLSARRNPLISELATPLTQEREELVRRLEDGDRKIAMAKSAGGDVSRLETLWIRLLREYEATCNAIDSGPAGDLREAA